MPDEIFQPTPPGTGTKRLVIAGSIGAVVVALAVVGVIVVRYRMRTATAPSPATQAPSPATGQRPPLTSPGAPSVGKAKGATIQGGVHGIDDVTPDYTHAPDSDHDGLSDPEEAIYGTDPHKADTDGDGYSDGDEVHLYGTNPLDPKSNPKAGNGLYNPKKTRS